MAIDNGDSENPQVYDPILGKNRDAFPGEIVQQSTLQRLMTAEDRKYQDLVDQVSTSGQFSADELNIILRAGKVASEAKRLEYLEAIRTNPAIIIQGVLKELAEKSNTRELQLLAGSLNTRVQEVKSAIDSAKTADRIGGRQRTELEYATQATTGNQSILFLGTGSIDSISARNTLVLELLRKLDALPEGINSPEELLSIISNADNGPESGKPYVKPYSAGNEVEINNLTALRPGLEGISFNVTVVPNSGSRQSDVAYVRRLNANADPSTWSRVANQGEYIPF